MAISADNKSIKIPEKHYVGFQKRGDEEVPLGFMTPDGEDKAALKRKATVDSWASGGWGRNQQVKLPAKSYDNKPLTGFKLGRDVRHGYGWGQGNVKWRIEDPRGFELEISSPNLAQILSISTVENGEILDKCVWGRLGNENVLLPCSSDVYKTAAANTERMGKKASLRDLKAGDYVILQNGTEGTYYGNLYLVRRGSRGLAHIDPKKRHIIIAKHNDKFHVEESASLKVAEIRQGERKEPQAYVDELNQRLRDDVGYGGYQPIIAGSLTVPTNFSYGMKQVTLAALKAMPSVVDYLIVKKDGHYGSVSSYWLINPNSAYGREADEFDIDVYNAGGGFKYLTEMRPYPAGHYNSFWGPKHYEQQVKFTIDQNDPACEWFVPTVVIEVSGGSINA